MQTKGNLTIQAKIVESTSLKFVPKYFILKFYFFFTKVPNNYPKAYTIHEKLKT